MLDFSRFEIFTFDCYGTLIDWEDGILRCLHRILAAHGKDTEDVTILQLYGDFEARAEQGEYRSYREVLQSVVRQFGEQLGFTPTEQEIRSLPESLPFWKPWPDTVSALFELHRRFRLAVVSNVDDDLFAATQPQLGLEFDQIVTAQQAKAYKPSLKIFELALSRFGSQPTACCTWAKAFTTMCFRRSHLAWPRFGSTVLLRAGVGAVKAADARPDLQVSSLAELAAAARP